MADLKPAQGVSLYEIPSQLFTDYAKKQRLIKLPEGETASILDSRAATYPDGTVVAKTFMFPKDYRDLSLGRRVIETRVMVKADGVWNVATYIWNAEQTDATLSLNGKTVSVSWISKDGQTRQTNYEIPGEVACVTCHQNSGSVALLGLNPRNLNRSVLRDGEQVNQLKHLQSRSVYGEAKLEDITTIVDSADTSVGLEQRARAYLDVNCSHCHNPNAWNRSARQEMDLRYETSIAKSGIVDMSDDIAEQLKDGEMPYIGTTVLHDEGLKLVLAYLNSL